MAAQGQRRVRASEPAAPPWDTMNEQPSALGGRQDARGRLHAAEAGASERVSIVYNNGIQFAPQGLATRRSAILAVRPALVLFLDKPVVFAGRRWA